MEDIRIRIHWVPIFGKVFSVEFKKNGSIQRLWFVCEEKKKTRKKRKKKKTNKFASIRFHWEILKRGNFFLSVNFKNRKEERNNNEKTNGQNERMRVIEKKLETSLFSTTGKTKTVNYLKLDTEYEIHSILCSNRCNEDIFYQFVFCFVLFCKEIVWNVDFRLILTLLLPKVRRLNRHCWNRHKKDGFFSFNFWAQYPFPCSMSPCIPPIFKMQWNRKECLKLQTPNTSNGDGHFGVSQ